MLSREGILDRLILVGGPPRSGTTFIARALNDHPRIVTAADDHVAECWGLYHHPTRQGLVTELRRRPLDRAEASSRLAEHLFRGDRFGTVAPSAETSAGSLAVGHFRDDWLLCLKSPEISFVLPGLARAFGTARFVLVYRSIAEIAESMFRMGETVSRMRVFHRRWEEERLPGGGLALPPGVPTEWEALWQRVSGFQRCAIYAASYLRAICEGAESLPGDRLYLYNHARLRAGEPVFPELAGFLGVEPQGFLPSARRIRKAVPALAGRLRAELHELTSVVDLDGQFRGVEALARRVSQAWSRA